MENKAHWEHVYTTKDATGVSWYRPHLDLSLQLIERTGVDKAGHIIDVGGGASTLVDDLLGSGYRHITVLDISAAALRVAQERVGENGGEVIWIEGDITQVDLPDHAYDVWHDRAVFHFLTRREDRERYIDVVGHALKAGGHAIIATFASDGPSRCSGLDVMRYDPQSLSDEFGDGFTLIESVEEVHETPAGTGQQFVYCCMRAERASETSTKYQRA